ncbi:hypothetical protein [Flavisolibacter nicotianae]|uniref:hypothetical protein n=1 Tax=Flavisolibacter nicotianae TaxID=2364882 RepID=UPI000EB44869|nr:hypothetical protein [Flavisolibacter nicotianae]
MPAQTTYSSPINLLSLTPAESTRFSPDTIEMALNRLGTSAERDEATKLLQHTTPATWAFHRTIYEQEGLLQFLEEGVFDAEKMSKAAFLSYNPAFVQFISSSFAQAFRIASKEALQKNDDYQTLQKLLDYRSFVLPPHQAIACEAINDYLHHLEQTVALLSWEQFVRNETVLDFAFSPNWIHCINHLPAACDVQRTAVLTALVQVLKRFRLDASPAYLKALCASLRQLKTEPDLQVELQQYEDGFSVQAIVPEKGRQKPANRTWMYYAGGGLFVIVAVVFLVLQFNPGNKRPLQTEDKYMDAVETTSAKDQLRSSVNEKNLKGFFYLATLQENKGKRASLQTGVTPIPDVTKMPANDGNSTMTIRNETTYDVLLFYFGVDNPLINKNSRLIAVAIKSGDVFRFRFQPDFGRFNFVFGREWVHLDNPAFFPFTEENNSLLQQDNKKILANAWVIKDFFRRVLPSQPLLRHDLTITNIAQTTKSTSGAPVYIPLNEKEGNKRYSDAANVEINLQEKDGEITVRAKSSLYVYQSPPTFDPKDFQ